MDGTSRIFEWIKFRQSSIKLGLWSFFLFWMVMGSFPTGWIYDLWAGTGIDTGQKPDSSVVLLTKQEEVKAFYLDHTPATVLGDFFIACPLLRLRDLKEEGIHTTNIETGRQRIMISGYQRFDYPMNWFQKIAKPIVFSASYNGYYLVQLSDGTYLCTFFDDYLMMGKTFQKEIKLPAGKVRYTTTEEKNMLRKMSKDYDVDIVYVLDMYNHKKSSWLIDKPLRLFSVLAMTFVYVYMKGKREGK